MSELSEKINAAVAVIRKKTKTPPDVAIILGTGLGKLADEIKNRIAIEYKDIPGFPLSTVETHSGRLISGTLGNKNVLAMQGRFHRYEGYTLQQIVFPVRVMRSLGAKILLIASAAGGLNESYQKGDLMMIADHINLLGDNPLIGQNDEKTGPRFPDMSAPYDRDLISIAEKIGSEEKIRLHKGVYVSLTGPSLETAAEYRFLRQIRADVVGMSTVPEVIAGVHAGFRIFAVAVVTDMCLPDSLEPANVAEIIRVAESAEPKLVRIMSELVKRVKL